LYRSTIYSVSAAILLTCLSGCVGGQSKTAVFPVSGKVLVDGQPAARAEVTFHKIGQSEGDHSRPFAITEADGSFRLSTFMSNDGAPTGQYTVLIAWPSYTKNQLGEEEPGADRLGRRYCNLKQPLLKAMVSDTDNVLAPFELKTW
jgi:hypothetical protein